MLKAQLRILLVDEFEILRNGLRTSLDSEAAYRVVGAVGSIDDALMLVPQVQPELVITELQADGRSAVEFIHALRAQGSLARVLVLTATAEEANIRELVAAGASAYLLKEDGYDELLAALPVVAGGRRFFSDTIETLILSQYAERVSARFAMASTRITPREQEVLARIGQGQTNKAIAKALKLSVKTVEKHRSNLMRKLGLHNTAAVTVYAMRQGLVDPDLAGRSIR